MQFITAHVQIDVEYDPYRGPTGLPEALSSEILFDVSSIFLQPYDKVPGISVHSLLSEQKFVTKITG
jgi:hypothetical protein